MYLNEKRIFFYSKRTAMQRHVKIHSTKEPHKCHICGKYYKTKDSLRIHIMYVFLI